MKCFKIIGVISLLIFSFLLTDFVTELAIYSNPLIKEIETNSEIYNVKSVDAIIKDNTIIPGINGKKVNVIDSYLNMKDFGVFNTNYLLYDTILPDVSVNDNLDKIIISGNKKLRNISILIKDNKSVIDYNDKNNIIYSKLISDGNFLNYKEIININSNKESFNNLDILLNKNKSNKKICILNFSNIESCKEKKYYLVNPSNYIKNNNYINELNNISNGNILFIDDNLSIKNYKIIIDYLNNKDLKIVYLSDLIKE